MTGKGGLKVRSVTPALSALRNVLLGREFKPETGNLRYKPLLAPRTQPPPILPDGPHHKLSANYYCTRDARREAKPPELIVENSTSGQKLLTPGSSVASAKKSGPKLPGKTFNWDM